MNQNRSSLYNYRKTLYLCHKVLSSLCTQNTWSNKFFTLFKVQNNNLCCSNVCCRCSIVPKCVFLNSHDILATWSYKLHSQNNNIMYNADNYPKLKFVKFTFTIAHPLKMLKYTIENLNNADKLRNFEIIHKLVVVLTHNTHICPVVIRSSVFVQKFLEQMKEIDI